MSGEAFGLSQAQDVHYYDVESGHYISENFQRLAEVIMDYDPSMRLAWIPPEDRANVDTHPFAVMQQQPDHRIVMVMKLTETEMRNPERVLARIFAGDTRKHDVLADLEKEEAARQVLEAKRQMDADEERRQFAIDVLKSPKSVYRHNGVKYT